MPTLPANHRARPVTVPVHDTTEQLRGNSASRGYGHRWRKAREGYFAKHPLCVQCQKEGRVVAATDLDHIIPHRGDKGRFWDRTNWQGLCKAHHSAKTAREDRGFGNR